MLNDLMRVGDGVLKDEGLGQIEVLDSNVTHVLELDPAEDLIKKVQGICILRGRLDLSPSALDM